MFDTHCHLNFKRFKDNIEDVITRAKAVGVTHILVPGTDADTSQKAVEIASRYEGVYAAVGIHPHHAKNLDIKDGIEKIKALCENSKVVAIGEVGIDKFHYSNTKYQSYIVDKQFIDAQKRLLIQHIKLALDCDKSLILHNREAKSDLLPLLEKYWDMRLEGRAVFHCCEPDLELLKFAQKHAIFIGVDGDVTYSQQKAEFIKKVPLEMLVVETDSPYLLPEPLRRKKEYPNEPKNIPLVIECVAQLKRVPVNNLKDILIQNTKRLFVIMDET